MRCSASLHIHHSQKSTKSISLLLPVAIGIIEKYKPDYSSKLDETML
jgi:hypothetical protein